MSICLIDTSAFCNILRVPGKANHHTAALQELGHLIEAEWSLLLPLVTVYETGNHIANAADGNRRRIVAEAFVEEVSKAVAGTSPWTPTPIHSGEHLAAWLDAFPDSAMAGISLADLSIIETFHEQCRLHPGHRVRIWSYDAHLAGYDRVP